VPEGSVINSGDLIARLELDDPGAVTAAVPYPGGFPELGPPLVHSQGVDHRFKEAYAAAKMIMAGAAAVLLTCRAAVLQGRSVLGGADPGDRWLDCRWAAALWGE